MQFYRSYYYVFALQQQIQALIYNRISYPYIEHEWIRISHAVFLVRDFYNNQLRYDSTESFSVDYVNQGTQVAYLVPLSLLNFQDDEFEDHPYLQVNTANQPVLILRVEEHWHCLLPCSEKPTQMISPPQNTDPRDYLGFLSSQYNDQCMMFTIFPLKKQNLSNIQNFTYPFNWAAFAVECLQEFYPYTGDYPYTRLPLKLVNNLAFEDSDRFLLKQPPQQVNIGFSLWNELAKLSIHLLDYQHDRNENSSFRNLSVEQRDNFYHYQQNIEQQRIILLCHLANQYERAFMEVEHFCHYLKQYNMPVEEKLQHQDYCYRTDIEQQLDQGTYPDTAMNGWKATLHLILFFLMIFVVLYAVYWLSLRFAFINWLLWVCGAISLLVIIARK